MIHPQMGLLDKLKSWRQKGREHELERAVAGEDAGPSPAMRTGADLGHGAVGGGAGGYGTRLPDDARGPGGEIKN